MPNLYVTPAQIKDDLPDLMGGTVTKYDDPYLRIVNNVSRWIDRYCRRVFFPVSETRYFDGNGKSEIQIGDVISISALEYSEDDGENYTALTESGNWLLARLKGDGLEFNHPGSYNVLVVDPNSTTLSAWPTGHKSLKVTGVWAYADDRDDAWEDSNDTVEDNPLADSATTLTVNDVDGSGLWGLGPRLHGGLLGRAESEYFEIVSTDTGANTCEIVRGRNGTTAAEHAQNTQIDVWRPPEPVREAAMIMAVRQHQRSLQGYADSRANADLGQMFWLRKIDPEVQELLSPYRIVKV